MSLNQLISIFVAVAIASAVSAQTPSTSTTPPTPSIDELRALPYSSPISGNPAATTGVVTNSKYVQPGWNLYADRFKNRAALFTNDGTELHSWSRPGSASWGNVRLLPSGELLVIETWDEMKKKEYPAEKGFESRIVKLSRDSQPVWVSHIPAHHDMQVFNDGTFLTLSERRRKIRAVNATVPTTDNGVVHVSSRGRRLSEFSLYDIISKSRDVKLKTVKPERGAVDLFHTNSIESFREKPASPARPGPLYAPDNLLFCSRHQDLIGIINTRTRKLVWSWGQADLGGPHAARLLDNGNILVFDNGLGRNSSRIVEVDPRSNQIVWTYQADRPQTFYSGTGGYSQRLANGNTLITDSWKFTAFEVTQEGRIVWRFISPEQSFVYRVVRYAPEYFTAAFRQSLNEPTAAGSR